MRVVGFLASTAIFGLFLFCTAVDVHHTHIRARMKQRAAFKVMYSQTPEEEERRDPDDDDDSGRVTLADGRRVPNGQKTPEVRGIFDAKSIFRINLHVCFRELHLPPF